jgi:hypothetical protein
MDRLGWILAFLVVVVLIAFAPDPWRLWLALAFAAWCVTGFVLVRGSWRDESLGGSLVDALTAPFGLLLYSPFMLLRAKDAWTLNKFRAEFKRIGADDVRVDGIYDQRLDLYDVLPGATNFNWAGRADEALRRLRSVPDNAGRDGLWSVFPELTSPPFRALNAELERIAGGNRVPVLYAFRGSMNSDPLEILESWDEDDETPPPDPEWTWKGNTEEALERLRHVRDGTGRNGLWDAFPDKTRSYSIALSAAFRRISGDRPTGVSWSCSADGRLSLQDHDDPLVPLPRWAWEGGIEDAFERFRTIPDGTGREGVWKAFPDKRRLDDGDER